MDLIYKYPQQQRERFYDRIQLLKQNLTQLKICLKDTQVIGGVSTLEKKYQQVYMKVVELRQELSQLDSHSRPRRSKTQLTDMSSFLQDQNNKTKVSTNLKNDYETAVKIIG